jgi:hypothetical protein
VSIIDQFSLSNLVGTDASVFSDGTSETNTTVDSSLESGTGVGAYFSDILASLQGAASNLVGSDASDSDSDSALSTAASGIAATGLFSSLLSSDDTSSTASDTGESLISSALTSDESIAQIQEQLMTSLNANLFGGLLGDTSDGDGTASLLTGLGSSLSDDSLSSMQANLLSTLHTSLFAGLLSSSSDTSEESLTTIEDATSTDTSPSYLQNLSDFSFGEDGLGLNELFDTVNIAQHVPIVSSFYQDMTGEGMSGVASLAGGFLYGGPTGLALSAADLAFKGVTGATMSDAIVDFDYAGTFFGDSESASVAQEALQTSDEPVEESTNVHQLVSRLF